MSWEHLIAEVVECSDLLLIVLHCHWGILGLGGFMVVIEVTSPQGAHFGPQYFDDPRQEDGGVGAGCGLPWEIRRGLVNVAIEFDREFSVVEFFLISGGRVDLLLCQQPLRVEI
jgi:hypothetical protein